MLQLIWESKTSQNHCGLVLGYAVVAALTANVCAISATSFSGYSDIARFSVSHIDDRENASLGSTMK